MSEESADEQPVAGVASSVSPSETDGAPAAAPSRPAKPWEQAGTTATSGAATSTPTPQPAGQATNTPVREDQVQNAVAFLSHPKPPAVWQYHGPDGLLVHSS
eukprot:scaffold212582_cov28-Prasinocladus_malaysianus.AAC.1